MAVLVEISQKHIPATEFCGLACEQAIASARGDEAGAREISCKAIGLNASLEIRRQEVGWWPDKPV
jgi:hypothetical protein